MVSENWFVVVEKPGKIQGIGFILIGGNPASSICLSHFCPVSDLLSVELRRLVPEVPDLKPGWAAKQRLQINGVIMLGCLEGTCFSSGDFVLGKGQFSSPRYPSLSSEFDAQSSHCHGLCVSARTLCRDNLEIVLELSQCTLLMVLTLCQGF